MSSSKKENVFVEKYLTPVSVLLGFGMLALAILFSNGYHPQDSSGAAQGPEVNVKDVKTDGSPSIGNPKARETLALFYDYQCPFCKQFELTVMPQLMADVEAGKLRVVFKDFQFLGQYSQDKSRDDSMTAAVWGRAVWEAHPDRFYDWFKAMMEAQDDENGGFGDSQSIEALTRTIPGIDTDRVLALVNSKRPTYEAAIQADYEEGTSLGVNGTPTAIIGKQFLSAISPQDFVKAIKAEI
jgi:protein-disulfide isomerase